MGIEEIRNIKGGSGLPKKKKVYYLKKKSDKKIAQEQADKSLEGPDEDSRQERWYKDRRKEMTGFCQCGCNETSSYKEDKYFRHSAAHIFPKAKFESVRYHPDNWVERNFWVGHHSVMDDAGIGRWPLMRDWGEIMRKFFILEPLLTEQEKSLKFYSQLRELVLLSRHNSKPKS